jgi:outer membrane scaffolding protein for murein synthesis (MipA/OmpV family)
MAGAPISRSQCATCFDAAGGANPTTQRCEDETFFAETLVNLLKPALVLSVLAAVPVALPAYGQEGPVAPDPAPVLASEPDFDADSLTIGGGAVWMPDYEGSNDNTVVAARAIGTYQGFSVQVAGNRISADLIPDKSESGLDFQAGPVAVLNLYRSSLGSIDDRRIRALGRIDRAIELGGYVGIGKTGVITSPYDRISLSVSYRKDVSGDHRAGILAPTVTYLTPLSRKTAVALFVAGERAERGYARTYFSITPAQATASGLPAYNARGGWKNWTVGAIGTVSLTGDLLHGLKLVGGGTYSRLLNDFARSPVVSIAGARGQWLGAVGLAYTF